MRGIGKIAGILGGAKEKTSGVAERLVESTAGVLGGAKEVSTGVTERVIGGTTEILGGAREITAGVADKVIDGTAGLIDEAKEASSGMADKVIGGTVRIAQDCKFSERAESIRKRLDENTPNIVKDASRRVVDSVDVLTGAKLLEVVQEMLQAQEEYNDVLATKLDEALTRIAMLEVSIRNGAVDEDR